MKVVVTNPTVPFSREDLAAFDGMDVEVVTIDGRSAAALLDGTRDADALIVLVEDITREVIENMDHCRSITRLGIGVDSVDVAAATERGIWVTNVPDANYREVAVHAIALTLAISRRLFALDAGIRRDGWTSSLAPGVHRPDVQVFGLLGLGRIGTRTAEIARSVGFEVIAHDPVVSAAEGVRLVPFDELVRSSDVLSLHVPLLQSTRDIISKQALASMKPGAILVNVSRGGLIDEAALAEAVRSGHLFGAGLDAFAHEPLEPESPLRDVPGILLTPHAAHWSEESWSEVRRRVMEEAARVLRGAEPQHAVNTPAGRAG